MDAATNIVLSVVAAGALLTWTDPNPPGVVESFNVYWRSEAAGAGKWTLVTNVTTTSARVQFYSDHGIFTVTASNAVGECPQLPVGGKF